MSELKNKIFVLSCVPETQLVFQDEVRAVGFLPVVCASQGALTYASGGISGCVLVDHEEYPVSKLRTLLERMGQNGLFHAIVVLERTLNAQRLRELWKLPVFDCLPWGVERSELHRVLEEAEQSGKVEGLRRAAIVQLRKRLDLLDETSRNVFRLLYQGLPTNRAIADRLQCGLRTVENRRALLLETFQVKSLAELIRIAAILDGGEILPNPWRVDDDISSF